MAKFKSKGALVYIEAATPPTVLIGQLGDSSYDNGERNGLEDASTHDNTSGTEDKLDVGFKSPPSLSGELILDPSVAVHEVIRAANAAGTAGLYCKVVLPDTGAAQFIFPCRVKTFNVGLPVKGKLTAQIMIEGTGAETFTA